MSNTIRKKERDFVQVSNSFLRDNRISFKAKGLFCYMFSMDDNWNFTIRSIATQQKDGQASIISSMDELKEFGYITYTKHANGKGTYFLDDEPNVENPNVDNPKLGKPTPIKKTNLNKNTKDKKPSFESTNTEVTHTLKDSLLSKYKKSKNASEVEIKYIEDYLNYRWEIKKTFKTISPLNKYWETIVEINKNYNVLECIKLMKSREWQTIEISWLENNGIKKSKEKRLV